MDGFIMVYAINIIVNVIIVGLIKVIYELSAVGENMG